jgi:hypothetical protein
MLFRGRKALFGPIFLIEAEQRVDDHHASDDDRVLGVADRSGQNRSTEQHEDAHAGKLAGEYAPCRSWRRHRQAICAKLALPRCDGVHREAVFGLDAQAQRYVSGCLGVREQGIRHGSVLPTWSRLSFR